MPSIYSSSPDDAPDSRLAVLHHKLRWVLSEASQTELRPPTHSCSPAPATVTKSACPFIQLLKATALASMVILPSLSSCIQAICKPHRLGCQHFCLDHCNHLLENPPGLPDWLLAVCFQHDSQRRSVMAQPGHRHSLRASSGFPGLSEQKNPAPVAAALLPAHLMPATPAS